MPRRTAEKRTRDVRRLVDLFLKGWSTPRIASELQVSPSTVRRDLHRLLADWRKLSPGNISESITAELHKLFHLEEAAWQAWTRSCDVHRKTVRSKREGPRGGTVHATVTETTGPGDSAFLRLVAWSLNRRCRLLGLDAPPSRSDSRGPGSSLDDLTDAQLAQLERRLGLEPMLPITSPRLSDRPARQSRQPCDGPGESAPGADGRPGRGKRSER
jgi:hypothetical protein